MISLSSLIFIMTFNGFHLNVNKFIKQIPVVVCLFGLHRMKVPLIKGQRAALLFLVIFKCLLGFAWLHGNQQFAVISRCSLSVWTNFSETHRKVYLGWAHAGQRPTPPGSLTLPLVYPLSQKQQNEGSRPRHKVRAEPVRDKTGFPL